LILKKFFRGCKTFFKKNKVDFTPLLQSKEDLPISVLDIIDLDIKSGYYTGRLWIFNMLKDLPFPESPFYVNVNPEEKLIDVFTSADIIHPMTG